MSENDRTHWGSSRRRQQSGAIGVEPIADPAFISSSAVSLSTSALFAALMLHLEQKGILSSEDQREIYELAAGLLSSHPADDGGITELAREVIEQQLRPD
jgi:hypothetical protein